VNQYSGGHRSQQSNSYRDHVSMSPFSATSKRGKVCAYCPRYYTRECGAYSVFDARSECSRITEGTQELGEDSREVKSRRASAN
jgi:hypothetical protein